MKADFQILVVDEARELCRALSGLLTAAGYRVECLSGSENPFSVIRERSPDLVILHLSKSDARGLETLRKIEVQRATRKVPVIVISGQAELEYELLDIFDFLSKPLNERRLLEDIALLADSGRPSGLDPYPPIGEAELALFQEFLIMHSGLHFDQRNSKILERGLMRRMRAVKARDYGEYHEYLGTYQESRQELKKLLDLLTIGETYFFRYLAHFEALAQNVIPKLLELNRAERTLRIWSAGCSSGEEPYSVAMLLLEHFPQLADWQVSILATDINNRALKKAREGVFRPRSLRVTDPRYRDKYFHKVGNSYVLDARVRDMVHFAYLNLQTGVFPSVDNGTAGLDILLCRNVMIYFRFATMERIVEKFSRCLCPGGYLFLGHAETLMNLSVSLERVHYRGGVFYRQQKGGQHEEGVLRKEIAESKVKGFSPAPRVVQRPSPFSPAPRLRPVPSPPEQDLIKVYARAVQAFDREDFETASQNYDIILRLESRHVGALVGKGFILANQGRYQESLDFCHRALEVDDLCAVAYFLRGLVLELQEDLEGAVEEYRKALLLDMDFIITHYNLSKIFWRMNRLRDARRELKNTLRLLERADDESLIPYSGGLSRAVFLEVCREDINQFGEM
jgi:chemotaxis protein methyltransferase CheR